MKCQNCENGKYFKIVKMESISKLWKWKVFQWNCNNSAEYWSLQCNIVKYFSTCTKIFVWRTTGKGESL